MTLPKLNEDHLNLKKINATRALLCLSKILWSCLSRSWYCLSSTARGCFKTCRRRTDTEVDEIERAILTNPASYPLAQEEHQQTLNTLRSREKKDHSAGVY